MAPDFDNNSDVPSFNDADLLFNVFAPSVSCAIPLTNSPDLACNSDVPSVNACDWLSIWLAPASSCCTAPGKVANWFSWFWASVKVLSLTSTESTSCLLSSIICWIGATSEDNAVYSPIISFIKVATCELSCVACTALATAACCSGFILVSVNACCKLAVIASLSAFWAAWIFVTSSCNTLTCCWIPAKTSCPLLPW